MNAQDIVNDNKINVTLANVVAVHFKPSGTFCLTDVGTQCVDTNLVRIADVIPRQAHINI